VNPRTSEISTCSGEFGTPEAEDDDGDRGREQPPFELLPLDPRPPFRFDTALPVLIRLNTTVKSSR
jgi:hypothetical protein